MYNHADLSIEEVRALRASGAITLGGNKKARIYGTLSCGAGKRLHREDRVFFVDEAEALAAGYRPCGNCMRERYVAWLAEQQVARDT
jgi:methylphosphotriester-DNA--protein-cysteine methyltransferase